MGNESTLLTEAEARHLLRRTGFGAPRDEVQEILDMGETRGAAVDRLLDFKPQGFKPGGGNFATAHHKWIKYMVATKFPIQEKLVLFWHDHFATAISKVAVKYMARQIQLLHKNCKGNMRSFVKAISLDGAMIEYLDTIRNFHSKPNENFARELQELFTLGVLDTAGNRNYTQHDIVQIARAFTGWTYDNAGKAVLRDYLHEFVGQYPERGPKTVYGTPTSFGTIGQFSAPQDFTVDGEGSPEASAVIDIVFAHRDTHMQNTVARRTARRLIEYFAHPNPALDFVDAVVTASGFDVTFEIAPLLRAIFVHDDFYLSGAPVPRGSAAKTSVKWPIDYVVSTLRLFEMKLKGSEQFVDGGTFSTALTHLSNMGQILMDPPSVFGWDWETNWLASTTILARCDFATDVTSSRGGGRSAFRPERFFDLGLTTPSAIVDEAATILGVRDHLTPAEHAVFVDYLTENGLNPSLDLTDYGTRNTKLHGLFALLMQSPAYQLH